MELYDLFRRNFPLVTREERTVRRILGDADNRIFEKRGATGRLIGAAVVHKNTIYLLCVDEPYRRQGIGSDLLNMAENSIREAGYDLVRVGAGDDYLTPGVPTNRAYGKITGNEEIYPELDGAAAEFFVRRGYVHVWDCDCFDMRFPLAEFVPDGVKIGDTVDGITYRFATAEDIPGIRKCTDSAEEGFTKYYLDPENYAGTNGKRVLIALDGETVCGALMVQTNAEGENLGSVGCTAVHENWQRRHIATTMVRLGTSALRDSGMVDAYLGYTYTGLDHLYGYAGYKICTYYMMAEKKL